MKENIILYLVSLTLIGTLANTYFLYYKDNASNNNTSKLIGAKSPNEHDHSSHTTPENKTPEKPKHPVTSIAFNEKKHDFGNIKQNTTNLHIFEFRNSGSNPLIISGAKGSCGCTVPEYPHEPIMPGEWSEIKVEYKPAKQEGPQTKTVTITANTDDPITKLEIRAKVVKEESKE
jgi:hypothetical protein